MARNLGMLIGTQQRESLLLNPKTVQNINKSHPLHLIVQGRLFCYYRLGKDLKSGCVQMWQYINKNPRGRSVGDCTVRAIATAIGKEWEETYLDLCLFGLIMADMPSANAITTAYLKSKGFRRRTIPDDCPDCYTIFDFCRDHPKGTYIIGTGSHLTTVIDSVLWDSWNSENETPVYYFEKMED